MKVSTEIDNNFGYEKITQLVDNIPLKGTDSILRWATTNISGFINARKILTVYIILKEFREISLAHMLF